MPGTRILFVDDEPGIRITLPAILAQHGFEVTPAHSVAEGLRFISSCTFDVLLTDLNIGEPGDGFTLVSAMKRTHPDAATIILTGYPGFETALQAIRNQVDNYVVKPSTPDELVSVITTSIHNVGHRPVSYQRLSDLLREKSDDIVRQWMTEILEQPAMAAHNLSADAREGPIGEIVSSLITHLELHPRDVTTLALTEAAEYGRSRQAFGFSLNQLLEEIDVLRSALFHVVQRNLLAIDLSFLIPDLSRINNSLDAHLAVAVEVFVREQRHPAA